MRFYFTQFTGIDFYTLMFKSILQLNIYYINYDVEKRDMMTADQMSNKFKFE
jgi:hypothetical protein